MTESDYSSYVGREEYQQDKADPVRVAGLAALLDHDDPPWTPGMLPPLGHWLCFPPQARQSTLGEDGHPRRTTDSILPAGDLPRRMWAGSRIEFREDIPLGASIERRSTLIAATPKAGRSGRMLFATVRHEIGTVGGGVAIIDEHDIVYREAAVAGTIVERERVEAGSADAVTRTLIPDPVMLFRYSALTFNGHRIHYDRDYARERECYPGLVVHGPLIATLLLDHLLDHHRGRRPMHFTFRASSPTFDGEPLVVGFTPGEDGSFGLRAHNPDAPAVSATAVLAPA